MALIDSFQRAFGGFKDDLAKTNVAAHGTSQAMHEVNDELLKFTQVFKAATFFGALQKAFDYGKQILTNTVQLTRQLEMTREELHAVEDLYEVMIKTNKASAQEMQTQKVILQQMQEHVKALNFKQKLSVTITEAVEKEGKVSLALIAATAVAYRQTIESSHEINRALIQANGSFDERFRLTQTILEAQRQTGTSLQSASEAASALTDYGLEMSENFGNSLKQVIMLRQGLGVSSDLSARLVVTWERGLKQPVKEVADTIANIAAKTGLAASKAAELAIQVGRAIRLLGPGLRSEASRVASVIGDITARVQELGGNSEAIVEIYKRLGAASPEGATLRGMVGVTPAQLATAQGAEKAMQGLQMRLEQIVRSRPGTEAYLAQVYAVSNAYGLSTDTVRDFLEAMHETRRELSTTEALQQAYNNQQVLTGNAWKMLRESLGALVKQALLPVLRFITPVIQSLADLAGWLLKSKVALGIASVSLIGMTGTAVVLFTRLAFSLAAAARNAGLLGAVLDIGGIRNLASGLGSLNVLRGGLGGLSMGAGIARLGVQGAAIGGAGVLGYALGRVLDKYLPDKLTWWSMFAFPALALLKVGAIKLGEIYYGISGSTYAARRQPMFGPQGSIEQIIAAVVGGKADKEVQRMILRAARDAGSAKGVEGLLFEVEQGVKQRLSSQQYLRQLRRTTVRTDEDMAQDEAAKKNFDEKTLMLENNDLLRRAVIMQERQAKVEKDKLSVAVEDKRDRWHGLYIPSSSSNQDAYLQRLQTMP